MNTLPVGTRSLQKVHFSAQGSGRNLTYTWSFTPTGDTATNDNTFNTNTNENTTFANGQNVVHQFPASDAYTVKVSVFDPLGHSSSDTETIDILPAPPVANFTINTDSFFGNFEVSCDASSSIVDPGTSIQNYTWNFGDGSTSETTSYGEDSHYYDKAGTYTITLVVTDATGQESQIYKQTVILSATNNT
jgi:PKD repeat protein